MMRFLRRIPFKRVVGLLAFVCPAIFLLALATLYVTEWNLYQWHYEYPLPDMIPLRDKLRHNGLESTSYYELEQFARPASKVVRAILITNEGGRIIKAYPRPDFFIGQNVNRPGATKTAGNLVSLMSRSGLQSNNFGVRSYEIVNNQDKLIGRIFVCYDIYAHSSHRRQWQDISLVAACLSFGIYWLLVALWVFADALANRKRALLWGAFALFTNLIGLLIYLLVKSTTPRLCPRCHRAMEEHFNACPYCGPVRTRLCEKCGSLVQSDWNFCPVCQMPMMEKADVPEIAAG